MSTAGPLAAGAPAADRRRPRDRKRRILAAAAEQFWRLGYHQVGMSDIAAGVGITASALYRHHSGKRDLLLAVVHDALDVLDQEVPDRASFDGLIDRLAALGLARREFAALWDREQRHLADADRAAVTSRLRAVVGRTTEALAARDPDQRTDVDLRARALLAVVESPSYHRTELDAGRFHQLLRSAAEAVVRAGLLSAGPRPPLAPTSGRHPQRPASRREELLAAAVHLFSERGYPTVSLTDIGAATGIAGPSVYSYFATKHDLLGSALNRGNEVLWLGLHHALARGDGPLDALHRALSSYTLFAAENPEIVSVMLVDTIHLPPEQHEHYRRAQHDYVAEWVTLLQRARPQVTEPEARVLVHACLALPNALLRDRRLRQRRMIVAEVEALARAVLVVPTDRDGALGPP